MLPPPRPRSDGSLDGGGAGLCVPDRDDLPGAQGGVPGGGGADRVRRPARRAVQDVQEDLRRGAHARLAAAPRARGGLMPARVWIDGAPVEESAARVPVFDRGFLYGDS